MPQTLARPAVIPATPAPSPETVAWAAARLAEIGFTPQDARWLGLSSARASELEAAMTDALVRDTLQASLR
jgi:hypothetical protein